jgi:hypothetical protein
MALHGLRIGKRGATLAPGGAVYVSSYEWRYRGNCAEQLTSFDQTAGGELVRQPGQKSPLVPATSLVFDSIGKKAFAADCPHID